MPYPNQLHQMILQHPALFSSMPLFPMIISMQTLISPRGITPILFGHLKYSSCLICSTILCTSSLNITFISPGWMPGFWILNSLLGLDWKPPCLSWLVIGALLLFCCQSSSSLLYSSICLMSYLISSGNLFVNDSRNSESSSNPSRNELAATFSLSPPISLYDSQYLLV